MPDVEETLSAVLRDSGRRRVVTAWVAVAAVVVLAVGVVVTNWRYNEDRAAQQERSAAAAADRDVLLAEIQSTEQELVCFAANSTEFFIVVADLLTYQLAAPDETLTEAEQQLLTDALLRLAQFRAEAAAGVLTCPSP